MALETGTYLDDLVITNPTGTDAKSEGDNHLRLIKNLLKATFPNMNQAITANVQAILKAADHAAVRALLNVENAADVTDTTNVTAAGALMDSEVDADIKTLVLPANTTITAAAATVTDDATVAAMVDTLGGATSTGTGGIARATSPTFVTPILGTPTSGNLANCTADGTDNVGFLEIPQVSQSAAYELVLTDSGKHIYHPSADTTARIWTIPANASVAFPIGTAVTFINPISAGVITIAITTDTMYLAGAGTTGSRTLAAHGIATAVKMTATTWIISGTGLT